jgi:hypothetical protein
MQQEHWMGIQSLWKLNRAYGAITESNFMCVTIPKFRSTEMYVYDETTDFL